jgi:hypothetical protein
MIDGIANTGTHTFVEKNKNFPIDIHLHVHSHSMRHYLFRWGITSWMVVKCRNVGKSAAMDKMWESTINALITMGPQL